MFSVLLVLLWTSCLLNLVLPSINNNSFSMKRKVNGYGARRAVKRTKLLKIDSQLFEIHL